MNISGKIWLSLSALVLGYLVTVTISSLLALHAEQRLDETATTLFPATTLGRTAEIEWHGQTQAYQEAVLTGEKEQLNVAAEHAKQVQKTFADLLALGALNTTKRSLIDELKGNHEAYTAKATQTYRTLASGTINDQLTSEAGSLSAQAQVMSGRFSALVQGLTNDLTGELAQTVARSANQRWVSLLVLMIAASVSISLVYVVISRPRRPGAANLA